MPSGLQNSALEPCARGGLRRSCGAVNTWVHVNSVPRSNIISAPRVQGTTAAEVVTGRICESQHPRQFGAWLLRACAPLVCGRASVLGLENALQVVVVPFCVALCDRLRTVVLNVENGARVVQIAATSSLFLRGLARVRQIALGGLAVVLPVSWDIDDTPQCDEVELALFSGSTCTQVVMDTVTYQLGCRLMYDR